MTRSLIPWLLALVLTAAHAQAEDCAPSDRVRVVSTCGSRTNVSVHSMDGAERTLTRFSLPTGSMERESRRWGDEASFDGGTTWPTLDRSLRVEWGDAGCRPLRRVALGLDATARPARPWREVLQWYERTLEYHWSPAGPYEDSRFWFGDLRRQVEIRSDGGVLAAFNVTLRGNPNVELEGYDVGDGRHLLLAAWSGRGHFEGEPQWALDLDLLAIDASQFPSTRCGVQVVRGSDANRSASTAWAEMASWAALVATELESKRSPQATAARHLATRVNRQARIVGQRAFTRATEACDAYTTSLGPPTRQDLGAKAASLVKQTTALHLATEARDWPLTVEALEWGRGARGAPCAELVIQQADAGAWVQTLKQLGP